MSDDVITPLTAEEEAIIREWLRDGVNGATIGRGLSALEAVPRLLATLDAARAHTGSEREAGLDVDTPTPPDPEWVHAANCIYPDLPREKCGCFGATPDPSIPERPEQGHPGGNRIAPYRLGSIPERPDTGLRAAIDGLTPYIHDGPGCPALAGTGACNCGRDEALAALRAALGSIPERPAEPLRYEDDQ